MLQPTQTHLKVFCLLIFLLTGCATIVSGPKQDVAVYSTPSIADVWIDGRYEGKTPLHVTLSTSSDHFVRIELSGYHPYEAKFTRILNGWLFGNFVFGGIIGIVVDVTTGSMFKLTPEQIHAHLQKNGSSAMVADGLHLLVVTQPHSSWEKLNTSLYRS